MSDESNGPKLASESYAQWGDDQKVLEYFKDLKSGTFVEAGANEPKLLSQTYLLEKHGWTGALVEPISECCDNLRAERPSSRVFQNALGGPEQNGILKLRIPSGVTALASALEEDGTISEDEIIIEAPFITLNEVLKQSGIEHLNFLSLDLEGMELDAMRGLNFEQYAPDLIIIEDRNGDLTKHNFLKSKSYKLVRRNGSNNWYVPVDAPFPLSAFERWRLVRKLYLSIPFRCMRSFSRRLRGKPVY